MATNPIATQTPTQPPISNTSSDFRALHSAYLGEVETVTIYGANGNRPLSDVVSSAREKFLHVHAAHESLSFSAWIQTIKDWTKGGVCIATPKGDIYSF